MKTIKNKTYYNFMYVMKQIQNKGYDFSEAEKMTHKIFNQREACPEGLSIAQLVDMIVPAEHAVKLEPQDIFKGIDILKDTRAAALKIAYSIPGYADGSVEAKNYIYDTIILKITGLIN